MSRKRVGVLISGRGSNLAALIAAAQKVEHYEIATYGSLRTFANRLGMGDVAQVLQQTLDEEGRTDKLLTQLAEGGGINEQAAH